MTIEEEIRRYKDLAEMQQGSKGYKWLVAELNERIDDVTAKMAQTPNNPDGFTNWLAYKGMLNGLNDFKGWVEETITKGRSLELMDLARKAKEATILSGTGQNR